MGHTEEECQEELRTGAGAGIGVAVASASSPVGTHKIFGCSFLAPVCAALSLSLSPLCSLFRVPPALAALSLSKHLVVRSPLSVPVGGSAACFGLQPLSRHLFLGNHGRVLTVPSSSVQFWHHSSCRNPTPAEAASPGRKPPPPRRDFAQQLSRSATQGTAGDSPGNKSRKIRKTKPATETQTQTKSQSHSSPEAST